MTRFTSQDSAFNRAVRVEIEFLSADERLVFFDTQNRIVEVIYPSEFDTGEPARVRARLEKAGRLKGIVHVSAMHLGRQNHAPRVSVVDYLPDGQRYHFRYEPSWGNWEDPQDTELATENYNQLWKEDAEET